MKKAEKILKKVLTIEFIFGIIAKRSRESGKDLEN